MEKMRKSFLSMKEAVPDESLPYGISKKEMDNYFRCMEAADPSEVDDLSDDEILNLFSIIYEIDRFIKPDERLKCAPEKFRSMEAISLGRRIL